jgi:hypothetical protein
MELVQTHGPAGVSKEALSQRLITRHGRRRRRFNRCIGDVTYLAGRAPGKATGPHSGIWPER